MSYRHINTNHTCVTVHSLISRVGAQDRRLHQQAGWRCRTWYFCQCRSGGDQAVLLRPRHLSYWQAWPWTEGTSNTFGAPCPIYRHRLSEIWAWICHQVHYFLWVVITRLNINFKIPILTSVYCDGPTVQKNPEHSGKNKWHHDIDWEALFVQDERLWLPATSQIIELICRSKMCLFFLWKLHHDSTWRTEFPFSLWIIPRNPTRNWKPKREYLVTLRSVLPTLWPLNWPA